MKLKKTVLLGAVIAGILDHACAMQAVIAPTVNSYKRTGAISTASGASWAPRFPTYGGNDRTHYVRVPDSSRIEMRGADGSANPYLAAAVALAAGLDGIKRAADPGALGTGPKQERLPATLLHAIERLETDEVMTGALDAAIPPNTDIPSVAAYFARLKKTEFWDWHSAVGAWEHERYLTAF